MNDDNDPARRTVEQCYRTNKTLVNPIIDWTDNDVWEFIHTYEIPYCSLYDKGWKRLGCIGCPQGSKKHKLEEFNKWPGMYKMYIRTFDKMIEARIASGKDPIWKDGEECMDWFLEDTLTYRPIESQVRINDVVE